MARFTASSIQIMVLNFINLASCQAFYASCPPGWLKWQQSCYILLPDKMNWFDASEACNRPGSSLVVPNSQEENDFIWESLVKERGSHWIGCTDAAQEGVWLCDGQPAQYTNWDENQPSTRKKKNCARVFKGNGAWRNGVECSTRKLCAACEMSASTVPAYHTFTGPDGRVSQRCLLHHDIKNLAAKGVLACGWACRADPRCRSFNLWQRSKKEKMCQLNDVTRLVADGNDFKATNNCYYFDL